MIKINELVKAESNVIKLWNVVEMCVVDKTVTSTFTFVQRIECVIVLPAFPRRLVVALINNKKHPSQHLGSTS